MFHRLWTGLLNRVYFTLVCTLAFFYLHPLLKINRYSWAGRTFTGLNSVRATICRHFLLVDKHEVFKEVKYLTVWYLTRCYRPWYVIVVRSSFARADFIHYHRVNWREKSQPQSYDFRRLSTQWNRTCRQQNNVAKFCYLRDVVTTLITNHYG